MYAPENEVMKTPIGCYPRDDRDLIALADLIATAIARLEIYASRPEPNERLFAYFDRMHCDEDWREPLLNLIRSVRDKGE